jgi:threonine/homoserine/homoserine lactone efflux protein
MGKLVKLFFIGMSISALGTLPLGTLNIISMQLSVSEGYLKAGYFAIGVAIVEVVYVRISLVGMDWVRKRKNLFKWLDWIALLIVVALAVASFIAASKPQASHNAIINNQMNRFLFGLMLSAINPVQIPFWFGWSTVLFSKKVLESNNRHYNFYIVGIGLGTIIGHSVFIFGGQLFAKTLEKNANIVNYVVGSVFAITAIIQLVKILQHKGMADSLEEKQEGK